VAGLGIAVAAFMAGGAGAITAAIAWGALSNIVAGALVINGVLSARRAKRNARIILCGASWLTAVGFAGGLEGTEPMPSMTGAVMFIIISLVLMPSSAKKISLTKAEGATQ
jgi:hypothetical protein